MDQFIYRIWKKLHLIISSEDAYETWFPPTPRLKGKFGIQKNATARYDSAMVPNSCTPNRNGNTKLQVSTPSLSFRFSKYNILLSVLALCPQVLH